MRAANAYVSTRFLTRVCAKMVRAFCVCVGHLSLTFTVFNKVLDITNNILCPSQNYSKMYEMEP